MNFTIDGASGAQAAGQGLGNMFKAAAMAPLMRQQAEVDSALKGAQIYHHQMAGNKLGTEAEQKRGALAMQNDPLENTMLSLGLPTNLAPAFRERMATGNWGGAYTAPADGVGPVMPAPANDDTLKKLGQAMSLTQRMFATGSNVHQGAQAALEEQKQRGIDAVVADPTLAPAYGKANAAAAGKPLFNDVGNTGYSMDNFTGGQLEGNPVLAKIYSTVENALTNQRNASAGNSSANAELLLEKLGFLQRTGSMPSAGGTGEAATNAKSRNAIIASVEKEYPGADESTISAEVEKRLARRGIQQSGNKNPLGGGAAPKIEAAPEAAQRKPNTVYQTPKGPMKWTGTGWLPAN